MRRIFIYFAVPIELSASTFCLWTKVHVQHKLGWTPMLMAAAPLRDTMLLLFSRSVVSNSLRPHGLQHTRLSCPSPSPGVYLNSSPFSWWCHPTLILWCPLLLLPPILPASGSFEVSGSLHQMAKILEPQLQHPSFQWIFRTDFL